MAKYRKSVRSEWTTLNTEGDFAKQVADATDGIRTYEQGCYRIIRLSTGKPAVRGKGGSVPFIGETAWSAAERLLTDLSWKERNR